MLIPLLGWIALLKPAYPPNPVVPPIVRENKIDITEGYGGVCHCLRDAKRWTGKYPPASSAYAILRNLKTKKTPKVGAIALMRGDPRYGHSAAVIAVGKSQVKIKETGWVGCNTVSVRWIPKTSVIAYYY